MMSSLPNHPSPRRLQSAVKHKHRFKEAALYEGTSKVLENTELEGADDLYYKGRFAKKVAHRASYAVNRSGRKVVQNAKSARDKIFKKAQQDQTEEQVATTAQSRAQAASYGKKNHL